MSEELSEKTLAIFAGNANKKLIAQLRADKRGKIIEFPRVATNAAEDAAPIESALENLSEFEWLIFPDVCAVDFFLEKLREKKFDFFALDEFRVCAFGEAVSGRLRFAQLHADVVPAQIDITNVYEALSEYLGNENEFENLRVLILHEASAAQTDLVELLREKKAEVSESAIYRLTIDNPAELPKLKALIKGGAIDEFIFAAPAEIFNLKNIFRENLDEFLRDISVSALDETTFQTLREHGLRPLYFKKN